MNFLAPEMRFCVDNASMIAWTGIERLSNGDPGDSIDFLPKPRWPLSELKNES
jgi:N6-L-threonylcarbamoyladenine synthase